MKNTDGRNIVAMLLHRERFAKLLLSEAIELGDPHYINMKTAAWSEIHNAAEIARRMLYDRK